MPTIAKILELAVKEQIVSHFTKHNLFSENQSAYIKGRSTVTALHNITDKWLNNINNGLINATCSLDLAKGFDTLSHPILLYKLHHYGIQNSALKWFESYLTNQKQMVKCNDKLSKICNINIGVPQGSILGPILFIICMNDLPSALGNISFEILR